MRPKQRAEPALRARAFLALECILHLNPCAQPSFFASCWARVARSARLDKVACSESSSAPNLIPNS